MSGHIRAAADGWSPDLGPQTGESLGTVEQGLEQR
jgi:hypothetical protein